LHTCNCASLKETLEVAGGGVQKVKCHVGWMGSTPQDVQTEEKIKRSALA
jgi:hypothetical protein